MSKTASFVSKFHIDLDYTPQQVQDVLQATNYSILFNPEYTFQYKFGLYDLVGEPIKRILFNAAANPILYEGVFYTSDEGIDLYFAYEAFNEQSKWVEFIQLLEIPLIRIVQDEESSYYETPLLIQTAAYWAHYFLRNSGTFTAEFFKLDFFWTTISDQWFDDPINDPWVDYDGYIIRHWYDEPLQTGTWLNPEYYYPNPDDKFLNLPNDTAYVFNDRDTLFEPIGQGKVFARRIWDDEEIFGDKDFYAVIEIISSGSGSLATNLQKVYKTNTNLSKTKILYPPKVKPPKDTDLDYLDFANKIYKPIYGSSVSFNSRLNYLSTSDNSLKLIPSSENNLVAKFNFKYLLNDDDLRLMLIKIENAEGYKNLQFSDPSDMYKNIIGLVENYSVNKLNININEINISIISYSKAPIFNWKTSSFLNLESSLEYSSDKYYKKHDFAYFDPKKYSEYDGEKNKIDNFWFAKEDIERIGYRRFDTTKWTKIFNHDSMLPFELKNNYDFYKMDFKNSFIQNIKNKDNSNSLKEFEFKIQNISDTQCRSILFFFEKKCGYKRFVYKFPFMFSGYRVFVCTQWNHLFKYYNCNDITATFVEDPTVNSTFFKFIESDFYSEGKIINPYPKLLTSL